jgi:hypothetical protein
VPANTKLVMLVVEHLNDYFDPTDGSALIPQCFGVIDAVRKEVALETTSCNLGRSLRLQRRDNRVDIKQLIVIVKVVDEKLDKPDNTESVFIHTDHLKDQTKLLIAFFKEQLKFRDEEIIYFTEKEIKKLTELLDQSKVYKHYPKFMEKRLKEYA